jgi:hypothetical protein
MVLFDEGEEERGKRETEKETGDVGVNIMPRMSQGAFHRSRVSLVGDMSFWRYKAVSQTRERA